LYELLATKGIHRPADLVQRVPGMTRQMAGMLWHGKRQISRNMARRLSKALGIPYADLMLAESVDPPERPPIGRPRKKQATGED
jgi:plasmid maintenance system antidote protein VapI